MAASGDGEGITDEREEKTPPNETHRKNHVKRKVLINWECYCATSPRKDFGRAKRNRSLQCSTSSSHIMIIIYTLCWLARDGNWKWQLNRVDNLLRHSVDIPRIMKQRNDQIIRLAPKEGGRFRSVRFFYFGEWFNRKRKVSQRKRWINNTAIDWSENAMTFLSCTGGARSCAVCFNFPTLNAWRAIKHNPSRANIVYCIAF